MEAEERPTKIRRLSGDSNHSSGISTDPTKDQKQDGHILQVSQDVPPAGNVTPSDAPLKAGLSSHDEMSGITAPPEIESTEMAVPAMSKNQLKKLRRKQEWEAGREMRKAKRKEKNKEKKARKRTAQQTSTADGPSNDQLQRHPRPIQVPVTIILDCNFDDLMMDGERTSLASQLTRCYSDNAKAPYRAHLALSSFGGKLKERFDRVLRSDYKRWKGVRTYKEDFAEVSKLAKNWMTGDQGGTPQGALSSSNEGSESGEVVYLTADCDETLTELKPYGTYIIGGLVDKNRYKGICYKRATEKGIRTAKLPIGTYMQMSSRAVLATNHVNEIMVRWLELGDWSKAFMQVMPKRKGGVLKVPEDADEDTNDTCELVPGVEGDDKDYESDSEAVESQNGVEQDKLHSTGTVSIGLDHDGPTDVENIQSGG